MEVYNWKIFDKRGSYVNWFRDSYLNIRFLTDADNAINANAYALTDPSGYIDHVVIDNAGWNYDPNNTVPVLNYTFDSSNPDGYVLYPPEASVLYADVSVFDPDPRNSTGIAGMTVDLSTAFIYPSVSYSGAFFLEPVAAGLVETEHLTILQETDTGEFIRPLDPSSQLVFRFIDNDEAIQLFNVNEEEQVIEWADEVVFDTDVESGLPITVNIGFKSDDEGVFERRLRAYERRGDQEYILAEFIVNAQAIGQDERMDTLLQNFAPVLNAKDIPHLFKEANINEAKPDWELINYKSKHAVLEYDEITPYIGSYKALINAIKWLGYEDIKVKEWFRDVKAAKKLGLYVPYEAEERIKTILYFTPEERKNLKKLNELSLIYCINRDTGEVDEWGNPTTVNCYEYNLNEILTKLYALKEWLEKNIIGVHARIVDLTGEGVYYERFRNLIYGTQNTGTNALYTQSLTPITLQDNSELVRGDASINLSLKEYNKTSAQDFEGFRFRDLIDYGWDASGLIPNDASILDDLDASIVRIGANFRNPFWNLWDIQWRASVEKTNSGVLTDQFVSNPLWIYDNDIRWYNIYDEYSKFHDISTNLDLVIEQAHFRDASNDNWVESLAYSIYKDGSMYVMESSLGVITEFAEYAIFSPPKNVGTGLDYIYSSWPWQGGADVQHLTTNAKAIVFNSLSRLTAIDVSTQFSISSGSAFYCHITGVDASLAPKLNDKKYTQTFAGSTSIFSISFPSVDLDPGYYAVVFERISGGGALEFQRESNSGISEYTGWTTSDKTTWTSAPDLGITLSLTANGAAPYLKYELDDNYMAPMLSFGNYKYTDISGNTQVLDDGKMYYLDILDGKIAMDSSILTTDGQTLYTTQYINFNYDTSLLEQKITLNVVYNSPRMPLAIYDPSLYYSLTISGEDPAPSLLVDNSVYKMEVNHIGEYHLEVFGWDGQNVLYNNTYKEGDGRYDVWTKYPTIVPYIDPSSDKYGRKFTEDISTLHFGDPSPGYYTIPEEIKPIFDRLIPLQGLTLEQDLQDNYYIKVPSITYFQDLPDPRTIAKFHNLTERCVSIQSPTQIKIDPDFQTFYQDDSINMILYDKGKFDFIEQIPNNVAGISGNIMTLDSALPSNYILDNSTQIYLQNDTWREVTDASTDIVNKTSVLDIPDYTFGINQLIGLIIKDNDTDYSWGSSYRVTGHDPNIATNGRHYVEGAIPLFVIDNSTKYDLYAKHSFSTYANHQIDIKHAQEIDNNFNIYLDDIYHHQYYLDNTFVFMNILFDHDEVVKQWYDPSDGNLEEIYYPYDQAIDVDISTLVILQAVYDPSNYMLNQKNIWTIWDHYDNRMLMRVFNDSVFYNFDASGTYDVIAESYDYFGNLKTRKWEGLITVS